MELSEALESVKSKFQSGNSIKVERAVILRTEWNAILKALCAPTQKVQNFCPCPVCGTEQIEGIGCSEMSCPSHKEKLNK